MAVWQDIEMLDERLQLCHCIQWKSLGEKPNVPFMSRIVYKQWNPFQIIIGRIIIGSEKLPAQNVKVAT